MHVPVCRRSTKDKRAVEQNDSNTDSDDVDWECSGSEEEEMSPTQNSPRLYYVPECAIMQSPINFPQPPTVDNIEMHKISYNKNSPKKFKNIHLLICIAVCVAFLAAYVSAVHLRTVSKNENSTETNKYLLKLENQLKKGFGDIYNSLEAVLNDVTAGTGTLGTFLFLCTECGNETNNMMERFAEYASLKLNVSEQPLEIAEEELHSQDAIKDYGCLLEKYRPQLEKKRVMVVKNLQNVPAQVAQIFHSLCDDINPQVKPAVFIFTLKVNSLEGKETIIADEVFENNWAELDTNILVALTTRIKNTIFKIQ